MRIIDGEYSEVRDDSLHIVQALTAGGGPLYPPSEWFENPQFDRPTPITVTADGRVKGHIASWRTDHIGLPPNTRPPRSLTDYAYFKTGVVQTDDGKEFPVGQLTLSGGHAPLTADAEAAVRHYDDTSSAVADVTVGEDEHGIWITGGVRPSVTEEQIRALRASAPSGDWRPINNHLELVAVCQVNTPGFPIARAMVASGEITALVAAGAGYMYGLQQEANVYEELARQQRQLDDLESLVASFSGKKKKPTVSVPDEDDSAESEAAEDDSADDDDERDRMRLRKEFRKRALLRR